MYKIVTLLLLITFNAFALPSNAEKHVQMSARAFEIDDTNVLALTLKHDKKWHTYWKNPGDAGLTTKFKFLKNSKKVKLQAFAWPKPKKYIEAGDILTFGYADTQTFFFKLDETFKKTTLEIKGQWLVCKDICIPGEDSIEIEIQKDLHGSSKEESADIKNLVESFYTLPKKAKKPQNLEIFLSKAHEENKLVLQYSFSNINIDRFDMKSNLLTPYLKDLFDYKREKLFYDSNNKTLYGTLYLDWNGIYEDPELPLPKSGVFKKPIETQFLLQYDKTENPIIITYSFKNFSLNGDKSLNSFLDNLTPIESMDKTTNEQEYNLFQFILFAFLGGLILNLMPCVLPVISLKLFGLISHSDESKNKILKHNLAYTAGVLSSFLSLGLVIVFLKSTGEKIGWGFQLQSAGFVFSMMILLLVMAMNMFGLFEFVTPGGKTLGGAQIKKGMGGDFLNGVLATILSTPCSAPFLGAALTFAFTTGVLNIFIIFFFVGLGLAFPFILTGFFPKTIAFLPKPGAWMDKLKKLLAFTLLLTFVWLYDVLMNIVDFNYFGIYFNTIFASLFMAFFFRKHISKLFFWNLIVFLIPIGLTINLSVTDGFKESLTPTTQNEASNLIWNTWSTEKMQELSAEKKWVFIDFTAKWCLTCKVNKKLVFNSEGFEKLIEKQDIELLIADWTKRDDYITDFLNKYKIVGVPAYFIQTPTGKVIHLGETISVSKIMETIKANQ